MEAPALGLGRPCPRQDASDGSGWSRRKRLERLFLAGRANGHRHAVFGFGARHLLGLESRFGKAARKKCCPEKAAFVDFASPDGKSIVLSSGDPGKEFDLAMIDAANGAVKWTRNFPTDSPAFLPKFGAEGTTRFAQSSENPRCFRFLDAETGRTRSVFQQQGCRPSRFRGGLHARPSLGDREHVQRVRRQ